MALNFLTYLQNKDFSSILNNEEIFRSFIIYMLRKYNPEYNPDEQVIKYIELLRHDLAKAWSTRKDYYRSWPKHKDSGPYFFVFWGMIAQTLCGTLNLEYDYRENGTGIFHLCLRRLKGRKCLYWLPESIKERDCKDFYNSRDTSDLTILSTNGIHKVHSLFLQMYGGNFFDKNIIEYNTDYSDSTIETFIKYIYLGPKSILREYDNQTYNLKFDIKEMIRLADTYHIQDLFDMCLVLVDWYTSYTTLKELCETYPENKELKKKYNLYF